MAGENQRIRGREAHSVQGNSLHGHPANTQRSQPAPPRLDTPPADIRDGFGSSGGPSVLHLGQSFPLHGEDESSRAHDTAQIEAAVDFVAELGPESLGRLCAQLRGGQQASRAALDELRAIDPSLGRLAERDIAQLGAALNARIEQLGGSASEFLARTVEAVVSARPDLATTLSAALRSDDATARKGALSVLRGAAAADGEQIQSDHFPAVLALLSREATRLSTSAAESKLWEVREQHSKEEEAIRRDFVRFCETVGAPSSLADLLMELEPDARGRLQRQAMWVAGYSWRDARIKDHSFTALRQAFREVFGELPPELVDVDQTLAGRHQQALQAAEVEREALADGLVEVLRRKGQQVASAEVMEWVRQLTPTIENSRAAGLLSDAPRMTKVLGTLLEQACSSQPSLPRPAFVTEALSNALRDVQSHWASQLESLGLHEYVDSTRTWLEVMARAGVSMETLEGWLGESAPGPLSFGLAFQHLKDAYAAQLEAPSHSQTERAAAPPAGPLGRVLERLPTRTDLAAAVRRRIYATRWPAASVDAHFDRLGEEIRRCYARQTAGMLFGDMRTGVPTPDFFEDLLQRLPLAQLETLVKNTRGLSSAIEDDGRFFDFLIAIHRHQEVLKDDRPLERHILSAALERLEGRGALRDNELQALKALARELHRTGDYAGSFMREVLALAGGERNRLDCLWNMYDLGVFGNPTLVADGWTFEVAVLDALLDECIAQGKLEPYQLPELRQLAGEGEAALHGVLRKLRQALGSSRREGQARLNNLVASMLSAVSQVDRRLMDEINRLFELRETRPPPRNVDQLNERTEKLYAALDELRRTGLIEKALEKLGQASLDGVRAAALPPLPRRELPSRSVPPGYERTPLSGFATIESRLQAIRREAGLNLPRSLQPELSDSFGSSPQGVQALSLLEAKDWTQAAGVLHALAVEPGAHRFLVDDALALMRDAVTRAVLTADFQGADQLIERFIDAGQLTGREDHATLLRMEKTRAALREFEVHFQTELRNDQLFKRLERRERLSQVAAVARGVRGAQAE